MKNIKTVMAFDFGYKRIGVAIGNTLIKVAHPIATIINKEDMIKSIGNLISRWKPHIIIVGAPAIRNDNKPLLKAINGFANFLKTEFKIKIKIVNEDYSSEIAKMQLNEQKIYGIAQKKKLDELSACQILQTYFSTI